MIDEGRVPLPDVEINQIRHAWKVVTQVAKIVWLIEVPGKSIGILAENSIHVVATHTNLESRSRRISLRNAEACRRFGSVRNSMLSDEVTHDASQRVQLNCR